MATPPPKNALSAAVWLTEAGWQAPYSRRVDSLANFQHTTAEGDDLYVRDLVDRQEPDPSRSAVANPRRRLVRPAYRGQHSRPER